MWLYSKDFFCSAVKDKNISDRFVIRFRTMEHANNFADRYNVKIIVTPEADYAYRAYLGQKQLLEIMTDIAINIDYVNFKDAVYDKYHNKSEHEAMFKMWDAMRGLQLKDIAFNGYLE